VGGWLVGFLSKINFFAIYFESISKIYYAGGCLCHPPSLCFRGGGRAPASKDSHLCWHKIAGGCCARQHKCVLAARKNRFWPSELSVVATFPITNVHFFRNVNLLLLMPFNLQCHFKTVFFIYVHVLHAHNHLILFASILGSSVVGIL
jgi:hypothetical protein